MHRVSGACRVLPVGCLVVGSLHRLGYGAASREHPLLLQSDGSRHIDAHCQHFPQPRLRLSLGNLRLRLQRAFLSKNPRAAGPLKGRNRILVHVGDVRIAQKVGVLAHADIDAPDDRITVQHGEELFSGQGDVCAEVPVADAGDDAGFGSPHGSGAIGAVRRNVDEHSPGLRLGPCGSLPDQLNRLAPGEGVVRGKSQRRGAQQQRHGQQQRQGFSDVFHGVSSTSVVLVSGVLRGIFRRTGECSQMPWRRKVPDRTYQSGWPLE